MDFEAPETPCETHRDCGPQAPWCSDAQCRPCPQGQLVAAERPSACEDGDSDIVETDSGRERDEESSAFGYITSVISFVIDYF